MIKPSIWRAAVSAALFCCGVFVGWLLCPEQTTEGVFPESNLMGRIPSSLSLELLNRAPLDSEAAIQIANRVCDIFLRHSKSALPCTETVKEDGDKFYIDLHGVSPKDDWEMRIEISNGAGGISLVEIDHPGGEFAGSRMYQQLIADAEKGHNSILLGIRAVEIVHILTDEVPFLHVDEVSYSGTDASWTINVSPGMFPEWHCFGTVKINDKGQLLRVKYSCI